MKAKFSLKNTVILFLNRLLEARVIQTFKFWKHITLHLIPLVMLVLLAGLLVIKLPQVVILKIANSYTESYMPTLQATTLVLFGLLATLSINTIFEHKHHNHDKFRESYRTNDTLGIFCFQSFMLLANMILSVPIWIFNAVFDPITNIVTTKMTFTYLTLSFLLFSSQLWLITSLVGFFIMELILTIRAQSRPNNC